MELTTAQLCGLLNISNGGTSKATLRWETSLGITGEKKKPVNGGYTCRHYSEEEVLIITTFEKELASRPKRKYVRVIPIDKIGNNPNQKCRKMDNIELGLYHRLTGYSGPYDARKWTVETKREEDNG